MSPKRFCISWGVTVLVIAALAYPVVTLGFLNLGGVMPGLEGVRKAYEVKKKIVRRLGNAPILFVVGGSSAYYGIDAVLMEKRLNRQVVNYGVHAGLGLDYQLHQLEKILKPGDSVLIAFEMYLLAKKSDIQSDFLHSYVATYDKRYLFHDGVLDFLKFAYRIPFSDWKNSLSRWADILAGDVSYCGDYKLPHLMISNRGDHHYKDRKVRPLHQAEFYGLGSHAKKVLDRFLMRCMAQRIRVYFTWGTAAYHPGFFSTAFEEKIEDYLSFLTERHVTVLDEYMDHLYPESFYSNTYNHLNFGGKRIRTEKIAASFLALEKTARHSYLISDGLFLVDAESHETHLFDCLAGKDLDYRVYDADTVFRNGAIDDAGIEKCLAEGKDIYFSDFVLRQIPAFSSAVVDALETKWRSLEQTVDSHPDHLFFCLRAGANRRWSSFDFQQEPLRRFFTAKGTCVVFFGTEKLSDVFRISCGVVAAKLFFKKGDLLGKSLLPFDIQAMCRGTEKTPGMRGMIRFGEAVFNMSIESEGVWCVVYDPELEIISDAFFFKEPGKNPAAVLYRASAKESMGAKNLIPAGTPQDIPE